METNSFPTSDNSKAAAIVSYFGIIGWLIAYFALHKDNKTEFGSYHLRQTLLFAIISTVLYIVLSVVLVPIIFVGGATGFALIINLVWIALFIVWIIGLIGAIQGQKKPIPLIGDKAQTMFSTI